MRNSSSSPTLMLAGGTNGAPASLSNPGQLETTYANLLSGAADVQEGTGIKTIIMTSAEIGTAAPIQIGITATAAEVADNFSVLQQIASFCRVHGLTVAVDAVLTNPAVWSNGDNALVDQWAPTAAAAGLPISSVEDVQEVATVQSPANYVGLAAIEANSVRTLISSYASSSYNLTVQNLSVGDMEGGSTGASLEAWWQAYNAAAVALGVPTFSFVTADTGWFGPWIDKLSIPTWQAGLQTLSRTASSYGLNLDVLVQGAPTADSAFRFVAQAEQAAAELAKLEGLGLVNVKTVNVQSWQALPVGIGEINSPTSLANEAAEIRAFYPLYKAGLITAEGSLTVHSPAQVILNTNSATSVPSISIDWSSADIASDKRLAVVLIDQTGTLHAAQHGHGTVANSAPNILVLNGNAADLAAELASITLTQNNVGPDTIDVATYGLSGRLSDRQIEVLAAAPGESVSSMLATSHRQGWLSSSATLNNGSVVATGSILTSETLHWSQTGTLVGSTGSDSSGETAFVKIVAIHEPLAEYGVGVVPKTVLGTTGDVIASYNNPNVASWSFPGNGFANNPGINNVGFSLAAWLPNSFDAAAQLTPFVVSQTVKTFNPFSGNLQSVTEDLAPNPMTIVDQTGTHPDTFASGFEHGGRQQVQYNTGDNPAWKPTWGDQFSSVTLTTNGAGVLVEAFFQGGASNPLFTVDDVFNPATGKLWEQFQSAPPPPKAIGSDVYTGTSNPYQIGYAGGPRYTTQFNDSNPNWDYSDWGSSIQSDTEVWTDYFIMGNFKGFATDLAVQAGGALTYYPLQFVNGNALDLMYLPGTINVDLNDLRTVTLDSQTMTSGFRGLNTINACGASGTISLTGLRAGGSTLIGGDAVTTLSGYGGDTIVAGAGLTKILTGRGGSLVTISSATGSVNLTGDRNLVSAVGGSAISISGQHDTVSGSGLIVASTLPGAALSLIGNNDTITAAAGGVITLSGTGDVLSFTNGGTLLLGAGASATAQGDGVTASMGSSGGTLAVRGNAAQITGGTTAAISLTGDNGSIAALTGSAISISGQHDTVSGSGLIVASTLPGAALSLIGNNNTITAAAGGVITLSGTGDVLSFANGGTLLLGAGASATAQGDNVTASMGSSGGTVTLNGDNDRVVSGGNAVITVVGNKAAMQASQGSKLTVVGRNNVIYGANLGISVNTSFNAATSTSVVYGNNNSILGSTGSTVKIVGNGNTFSGSATEVLLTGRNNAVTVYNANETVRGVTGNSTFYVTASSSAATIIGGAGINVLHVQGGGNIMMGRNITNIQKVVIDDSRTPTKLRVNREAGLVIQAGTGTDTVTAGAASQTVVRGAGALTVVATAATAGVAIAGSSGTALLEITSGGGAKLNNLDTNLTVVLDVSGDLQLGPLAFITAIGSGAGHNTIIAGGPNQTLKSIGGNDTLVGSASFGDIFLGTAAGLANDTIVRFGQSDKIDITDIAFASIKSFDFSGTSGNGILHIADASHSVTLRLAGNYSPARFNTYNDGHGGTLINYTGP